MAYDMGCGGSESGVAIFMDDENGYGQWLAANPAGYVLNCHRRPKSSYLKLHRSACGWVSGTPPRGNLWTDQYIKVCGQDRHSIEEWTRRNVGSSPDPCGRCLRQ